MRDWLDETGTTAYALSKAMGVPGNRLLAILAGRRAITADTAIRLGAATGTSAETWVDLQSAYDLEVARGKVPTCGRSRVEGRASWRLVANDLPGTDNRHGMR